MKIVLNVDLPIKGDPKPYSEMLAKAFDELCEKGIPKGCFQDYTILTDLLKYNAEMITQIYKGGEENE